LSRSAILRSMALELCARGFARTRGPPTPARSLQNCVTAPHSEREALRHAQLLQTDLVTHTCPDRSTDLRGLSASAASSLLGTSRASTVGSALKER
ncbi:MAG: hypothetical protein ABL982_20565, partial [Vicinamibacterales bacterium]